MTKNIYSVGQINSYIKNMFAQDFLLRRIAVSGEVSNCKYHASGHLFFSLKDRTGVLNAVMFKDMKRTGLPFPMKDGDEVIVTGSIRVFERDGRYQLYAQSIELAGAGLLYQKFEALKKELEEMGMFAPEYKRPIPRYPKTVGIVTASTGAAIRDIVNIASRRNPYVQLILCPAQVQGEGAAQSIVNGIRALEAYGVDVMIVGRGGGSIEDLWPFNERIVAEAIFDCGVPVVSAVGHETDTTIADFAADLRAPTPSAAAELVVYDIREVTKRLSAMEESLARAMQTQIGQAAEHKRHLELRLASLSPGAKLANNRERMLLYEKRLREQMNRITEEYRHRQALLAQRLPGALQQQIADCRMTAARYETALPVAMQTRIGTARSRLQVLGVQLDAQSPLKRLGGGYTYVTDREGHAVLSAGQLSEDMEIEGRLPDGGYTAKVLQVYIDEVDR